MLPIIGWLQAINDPATIVRVGIVYIASYYITAAVFHAGILRKNGIFDICTSIAWFLGAVALIASLLDLLVRNELPLAFVIVYYVLFIFLFAFLYSILEWHFPGAVPEISPDWRGEIQVIILSIQTMTGATLIASAPARLRSQTVAAVQSLLALLLVAVFIAKAVTPLSAN